jgi:hypothetical protein
MVKYTCGICEKNNFKNKQSAKNHLERSHKKHILDLEVRSVNKSVPCAYCNKYIEDSIESHLHPHVNKIITKLFDQYMSKSS